MKEMHEEELRRSQEKEDEKLQSESENIQKEIKSDK
jgi:hypothetical protein